MCWWMKKKEVQSPKGIVDSKQVTSLISGGLVAIRGIPDQVCLTTVADTNSMLPVIDNGDIIILTNGFNYNELAVGDIVVYEVGSSGSIIHRIENIQESEVGRVYTCKGDNNSSKDSYQILDEHIAWLLVGVVYCKK